MLFNNLIYKDNVANDKFIDNKRIADKLNLPLIETKTNLHQFYKKGLGFEQTHTLRNAVIPHVLSFKGIKFLYSSSFPLKDFAIKKWPDIGIVNSILLPLLSTENTKLFEVGNEYGRVEKTKIISKMPETYDLLDICIDTKHLKSEYYNCSKCYKCMRALVTFEKLGIINNYQKMFGMGLQKT